MKKTIIITFFLIFLGLIFFAAARAADVTLAWDRPTAEQEDRVHGYRIYSHYDNEPYNMTSPSYWGWKGQFCKDEDGNDIDTCSYKLPTDFTDKMYFIATAFLSNDSEDKSTWLESPASNEVVFNPLDTNTVDDDGDGQSENDGDCNDQDDSIYTGATEVCGDGIDQDCSGADLTCPNTDPPGKMTIQLEAVEGNYIYLNGEWFRIVSGS